MDDLVLHGHGLWSLHVHRLVPSPSAAAASGSWVGVWSHHMGLKDSLALGSRSDQARIDSLEDKGPEQGVEEDAAADALIGPTPDIIGALGVAALLLSSSSPPSTSSSNGRISTISTAVGVRLIRVGILRVGRLLLSSCKRSSSDTFRKCDDCPSG